MPVPLAQWHTKAIQSKIGVFGFCKQASNSWSLFLKVASWGLRDRRGKRQDFTYSMGGVEMEKVVSVNRSYMSRGGSSHTVTAQAYTTDTPGLVVCANTPLPRGYRPRVWWAVIHVSSGLGVTVGARFKSRRCAMRAASAITHLIDWTIPESEVRAAMNVERVELLKAILSSVDGCDKRFTG